VQKENQDRQYAKKVFHYSRTGRLKDLIIVRGNNHYPEDIERTIEQTNPSLRPGCGAAFSVDEGDEEYLAIVWELEESSNIKESTQVFEASAKMVRQAVTQIHQIQVSYFIGIQKGTLPKTSSGKVQRHACRANFLNGTLHKLFEWQVPQHSTDELFTSPLIEVNSAEAEQQLNSPHHAKEIQAWLLAHLASHLSLVKEELDVDQPFTNYGLDSKEAVNLAGELEDWLGTRLSPTLLWQYPTIATLSQYLSQEDITVEQEKVVSKASEPIAIIGLGCRFPQAPNPEAFWELLHNGVDAITEVPKERWDAGAFYDTNLSIPGKMNTRWGGFLDKIGHFDAAFFGISPREAKRMDPQQRLLLEVTWEAIERSGQAPSRIAGSRTGVFIGIGGTDYSRFQFYDPPSIDAYAGTGNAHSIAANRLSYFFDLRGPSLAIDTACSSSLVAIHLACQSLRQRESDMAIAGGVNLILRPEITIAFSHARMMSSHGRCRAFDNEADGYVRSEGCGVVVLKRLADALADGDPIAAVIRGTSVNQDGKSNGLTAPNGLAQEAVLREALQDAGVTPQQISYVEAHGTGTLLGDPIEMQALAKVLKEKRSEENPCVVGSVKTNIGHLEVASGVAGLIKVVLALQNQTIPPHLHFNKLNENISTDGFPFIIPATCLPWKNHDSPRLAGVSSFGFGGTNAHLIIEEAPKTFSTTSEVDRPLHLLKLSARSETALKNRASSLIKHFQQNSELVWSDVCFTANTGRADFEHRLVVVAESSAEACQALEAMVEGKDSPNFFCSSNKIQRPPKIAFLFTGQGSQYVGMGRQLYETQALFRKTLDQCDEFLRPLLKRSILEVLYPLSNDSSELHETSFTQPALFALEYALSELWRSCGIEPDYVMGHSVGEYVAACVAGVLTWKEGLQLIAERAALMQALPQVGKMLVILSDEKTVTEVANPFLHEVSIAAVNGPKNVVLSGKKEQIEFLAKEFRSRNIATQEVTVSHAFHSPLMEPVLEPFAAKARQIKFRVPKIPLISNLTGKFFAAGEVPGADYWCRHLREGVRFAEGIQSLAAAGTEIFLELGPNPVLLGMGKKCFEKDAAHTWVPSLKTGQHDWQVLLEGVAKLYLQGAAIQWTQLYQDSSPKKLLLPTYPFERQRYWIEEKKVSSPPFETIIEFDLGQMTFLQDHQVLGETVIPGAFYVDIAFKAAKEFFAERAVSLYDLVLHRPLFLDDTVPASVQLVLTPETADTAKFEIFHSENSKHPTNIPKSSLVSGWITSVPRASLDDEIDPLSEIQTRCQESMDVEQFYQALRAHGLDYGPVFRGIHQMWKGKGEALGFVENANPSALLDACFQVVAAIPFDPSTSSGLQGERLKPNTLSPVEGYTAKKSGEEYIEGGQLYLPTKFAKIQWNYPPPARLWSHAVWRNSSDLSNQSIEADFFLFDEAGNRVGEIQGFLLKSVEGGVTQNALAEADAQTWFYEIQWKQSAQRVNVVQAQSTEGPWILFCDRSGLGQQLCSRLEAKGERCVRVFPGEKFEVQATGEYVVDPKDPESMQRFFQAVQENGQTKCRGIIHLWSLDTVVGQDLRMESLEEAQTLGCVSVLHLVQAVAQVSWPSSSRLWLVTRATQVVEKSETPFSLASASLWGLGRVIALEHPELSCVRVDLSPNVEEGELDSLFQEIISSDGEDQIALRDGGRFVPRLIPNRGLFPSATFGAYDPSTRSASSGLRVDGSLTGPCRLEIAKPGTLEGLELKPNSRKELDPIEVEIEVAATGLNFSDVLKAMGLYPGLKGKEIPLGIECSGKIIRVGSEVFDFKVGDEVIAIAPFCFGNFVTTPAPLVVPKPAAHSVEEAATIPIAFLTAHYALNYLGRMRKGEKVLIHAGAGGVGLAAIQLAQQAGVEIFATAGSAEKREFLRKLGVQHVMDSRSLDFVEQIMAATKGQGVDLVLNSLAGEFIPKSLSVLAPYGRFLEIGKIDIYQDTKLGLSPFQKNLSYFAIDLDRLIRERPELLRSLFLELIGYFQEGKLKPLPHTIFPLQEAVSAFRYMAQRKNIGKVVVTSVSELGASAAIPFDWAQGERLECIEPNTLSPVEGYHRRKTNLEIAPIGGEGRGEGVAAFEANATYLITGGLGSLGLQVAQWMVELGARQLVLLGRRGVSPQSEDKLKALQALDAQVKIAQVDVADSVSLQGLFNEIRKTLPPLRGIIHAAGTLDDGVLLKLDRKRFESVLAPKIQGAWNLHALTCDLPLDFFVLFSSAAGILGSPGQGNYAAANAFLDALANYRRSLNLPALAINWGPWNEGGMAAKEEKNASASFRAFKYIEPTQGLEFLGQALSQKNPHLAIMSVDWKELSRLWGTAKKPTFLAELLSETALPSKSKARVEEGAITREAFMTLPFEQRQSHLLAHIQSKLAKILGIEHDRLDVEQPLHTLGLDSLMAIEMKNELESGLGIPLPMAVLLKGPSIRQLVDQLVTS
jgi:myxalamid-type polyketide synthase MxaB